MGINLQHPLVLARKRIGWTQSELAEQAGVPRSSVSAIESGRLTPSVTAALQLASALALSVESLFGRVPESEVAPSPDWSWPPEGDRCRFIGAEIRGRPLYYPLDARAHGTHFHDGIWRRGGPLPESLPNMRSTLVVASCDPAAAYMEKAYASESRFRMVSFAYNATTSLELLKAGLIHVAGLHRSSPDHPECNLETVRAQLGSGYCLLRAALWDHGLAFESSAGARSVAAVLKNARIWAKRESGSVARERLDAIHAGASRSPRGREVTSHRAVAESIRMGWADAGICVELTAREAKLEYLSLQEEALDLVFHESMLKDSRIQALTRLLQSKSYRHLLAELPGYDSRETGNLVHD